MFEFGKKTYIMGILNLTPDSFSDGGDFTEVDAALSQARRMLQEGADIIDIGAESTRPGASFVEAKTEIERISPVLRRLSEEVGVPISVDTYKAEVADYALRNGAQIINDVWGFQKDPKMAEVAAVHRCPAVVMHNSESADYGRDIIEAIKEFFEETFRIAKQAGVKENQLIIDPGIGFGKTMEQNIEILRRLHELRALGFPLLLGTSRKSTIGKILDLPPKERVEGTIATTVLGIMMGADIVRVHDVKENYRAAKVADAICRF